MNDSTNENYKSLIEQDLMLPDTMAIQNNLSMADFNISREDWNRINDVPNHVNKINIMLIIGVVISMIIFVIGLAVLIKKDIINGLVMTMFSLLMTGIFIYGTISFRSYHRKADEIAEKHMDIRPEELDRSAEYTLMNIFYILLMLFFILCLFVTILCFGFKGTYLNPIRTAAMNQNSWKRYYGEIKYNDVYSNFVTLMNIASYIGLGLSLFSLACLYLLFRIIGANRAWQNVNEFVCLSIYLFGFVMIYYGVFCLKYSNLINTNKSMPKSYPDALIIAGIVSIIMAVLGFIGSFLEDKRLVKVFAILCVFFSIFLLSIFISSIIISTDFSHNYQCKDFLQYVTEDYAIETLGCDRKYSYVGKDQEDMTCPKDRLVEAWEESNRIRPMKSNNPSGCLDAVCCSNLENSTLKNLNLISVFASILFALTVIISAGSFYVNVQLPHKTQFGIQNKMTKWILIAIASTIGLIVLILISMIPEIKFTLTINRPVNLLQIQASNNHSLGQMGNLLKQHGNAILKNLKGDSDAN